MGLLSSQAQDCAVSLILVIENDNLNFSSYSSVSYIVVHINLILHNLSGKYMHSSSSKASIFPLTATILYSGEGKICTERMYFKIHSQNILLSGTVVLNLVKTKAQQRKKFPTAWARWAQDKLCRCNPVPEHRTNLEHM